MKIIIALNILIFFLLIFIYVKISKPAGVEKYSFNFDKNFSKLKTEKILDITSLKYNSLPARVLYEKITFKRIKTVILYKLTIKNADKFIFFNVLEILKDRHISYSLIKEKKTEIFIVFKSLKEAKKTLDLFKFYNFPVKLQKIIKRI
jgi:hypothetical protein